MAVNEGLSLISQRKHVQFKFLCCSFEERVISYYKKIAVFISANALYYCSVSVSAYYNADSENPANQYAFINDGAITINGIILVMGLAFTILGVIVGSIALCSVKQPLPSADAKV